MSIFALGDAALSDLGYILCFLVMAVDGASIPFTPSEIFLAYVGHLSRQGELNAAGAFFACALGSVTGNILAFYVGKTVGRPFLRRFGSYLLLTPERLQFAEREMKKIGFLSPFVARFLPGLRNSSSLILGFFHYADIPFLLLSSLGLVISTLCLFFAGYFLPSQAREFEVMLRLLAKFVFLASLLVLIVTWVRQRLRQRSL